jgi:nucleoside diphosphate kinase
MKTKDIIKKFETKGYKLAEMKNLYDEPQKIMAFNNTYNLPIIQIGKNTTVYELHRVKATRYFFTNEEDVFEVMAINKIGFDLKKNDKLRKINRTNYEVKLNDKKYTFKNLKVFLGIV